MPPPLCQCIEALLFSQTLVSRSSNIRLHLGTLEPVSWLLELGSEGWQQSYEVSVLPGSCSHSVPEKHTEVYINYKLIALLAQASY